MTGAIKKLLLADDDRDDRELFAEALASVDPSIVCQKAEDGKQALQRLAADQYDLPNLIFLDINMPVMSGWEVLKHLKGDSQYANIPVIMYTTASGENEKRIAADLGAICFVTKPDDIRLVKNLQSTVLTGFKEAWTATELCLEITRLFKP
ncbi:MAG TPA: response regulator [Chryseolinea sp.]|nr:response regulator [Chryseolinea sp.]